MSELFEEIGKIGVVPVIKIDDADKALPLAGALLEGGIPCAEITFRTAQGEEAIRRVGAGLPEILLGAGTVLTTDQVDRAIDAGARFIVSPGFNPKVVGYCVKRGIPIAPGCSTPSDIEAALEFGLRVVKFFPAESFGGLASVKAMAAPYPDVKFMPTGGITVNNIGAYLAFEKVLACGGSWMAAPELISAGKFGAITALCEEALRVVRKARGFPTEPPRP
ncbi:MAG: bifunctional 4-hydroxy-2-oxoglutarate aldolase/2-dehydro-3-deoxy-phosphogluconate aldolase [Treponema sp.]|jgi:2-dehydro-3-deoxyphosphogluconate aldolase/(4S)-4-hydroxy-2-oxoglutarate aldolase|nr:bifunctional 4-hydroxy-2-oxoglutarate aldolase/2-dehydro-3-deoxy-phosphogluconate aldolase [Treponema sp.]